MSRSTGASRDRGLGELGLGVALRERLHAGFELPVAVVAVVCIVGLAAMVWQAARADGLSIQSFATPPDLVWRGALLRDKDPRGAARRFARATQLSPTWGLPLLRSAQALDRLGAHGQAADLRRLAGKLWLTARERSELESPST